MNQTKCSRTGALSALILVAIALPAPALAYGGPGSVVSGLGALLAALAALVAAIFGFVWFPVKRLLKRFRTEEDEPAVADD